MSINKDDIYGYGKKYGKEYREKIREKIKNNERLDSDVYNLIIPNFKIEGSIMSGKVNPIIGVLVYGQDQRNDEVVRTEIELLKYFIKKGVRLDGFGLRRPLDRCLDITNRLISPLWIAVEMERSIEIIKILVEYGADMNIKGFHKNFFGKSKTALDVARRKCEEGRFSIFKYLEENNNPEIKYKHIYNRIKLLLEEDACMTFALEELFARKISPGIVRYGLENECVDKYIKLAKRWQKFLENSKENLENCNNEEMFKKIKEELGVDLGTSLEEELINLDEQGSQSEKKEVLKKALEDRIDLAKNIIIECEVRLNKSNCGIGGDSEFDKIYREQEEKDRLESKIYSMKQEIDKYMESIAKKGSASLDEMNETINKFTKILGKNKLKKKDNCEKVMPTQETINEGLKILKE